MSQKASGKADSGTDSSDKEFVCPDCGSHFDSSYLARSHVRGSDCAGFECEVCEKSDFLTKSGLQTHKGMEHDNRVEIKCENCGEMFDVKPYRSDSAKYCSRSCTTSDIIAGWNEKEWIEHECEQCGCKYERKPYVEDKSRFCSRKCKDKWQKQNLTGENNPNWQGGFEYYYGKNWHEHRRKVRKRDNYTCQACGLEESEANRELSVHHIKRKGDFSKLEKANKLSNLVTLCRPCHKKWEGIPLKPTLLTTE